jgi:hypothetical protein
MPSSCAAGCCCHSTVAPSAACAATSARACTAGSCGGATAANPEWGDKAYLLALVPDSGGGAVPAAQPPFVVLPAEGWLVVAHDLDTQTPRGARTLAGIDALRAEAVRLARARQLS